MSAVSGAIPNLIGGVSQQPPSIRALNCSTALVNTWSDVVTGLSTRPAGAYVGRLGNAPGANSTVATHVINRPDGDFHISIYDGAVRVNQIVNGVVVPHTVTVEGGAGAYLSGSDAAANFGFVTVGNTTFIYNRSKTVTKTTTVESGLTGITEEGQVRRNPNRYGTVWMKQRAGYLAGYFVYVNGVAKAGYSTDAASPSSIAEELNTLLNSNGITSTRIGSTILSIQFTLESDYLTTRDDFGDQAMFGYNDYAVEFTKLPNIDIDGRLVLVRQALEEDADDYWVWFKRDAWEETYGWNSYEKPDNSTMPVILVYNGGTSWTLKYTNWPGRTVGDADSNPTPSFVGRQIRHMFLYKGRMCMLADENFLASRVGEFENFYRSTCTQLLDDDPIDIASPNSRGATMNFAKEFNDQLLLFSAFDQFKVTTGNDGLLSPNSVSIKRVTSYNNTRFAEPVNIGANIVFVDDYNQSSEYASLREYQVDRTFGIEVAPSITDAVPEYIPSGVYKVVTSSTNSIMAVVSKADRTKLWLYNYFHNSEGKVQSAWQFWTQAGTIYGIDFNLDKLLSCVVYDGGLHLLQYSFNSGADTLLDNQSILLDYRSYHNVSTAAFDGRDSYVTMPFAPQEADKDDVILVIFVSNTGPLKRGQVYTPSSITGSVATFPNVDLRGNQYWIGFRYKFSWKPSPIFMRDRNLVAIQDGRLQLRRMSLQYHLSGPFTTIFTPGSRESYTSVFSGFRIGDGNDLLGEFSLDSGEFRVAVNGQGSDLDLVVEAMTPWRVRFSTIEWDGTYRPRKKRTG